ncbi:MAG: FAD-binding oxidoreductase [Candidatus Paceibacterota bacterium]|jgi:FAD/FMN-containing dehydrogenase
MENKFQTAELIRGAGFEGEILSDAPSLIHYENDTSIIELRPELAVKPKDVDDIKKLVSFVASNKAAEPTLSLTARAAGTGMAGGALNESIIVDVSNLNHVKGVTTERAVVEPGVFYRDMDIETRKLGVIMPSFPASRDLCAVGGMTGTNASGEMTLSFGSTENWVRGIKAVLSDGNEYAFKPLSVSELEEKKKLAGFVGDIYRRMYDLLENNYDTIKNAKPKVSKNSAGYALWNVWDRKTFDLTKLFTGSEGTLGIFTEIEFALIKPKEYRKLIVVFLPDFSKLTEVVGNILSHKPETFETYDDRVIQFTMRYLPEFVKVMKTGLIKLGLSFIPEALMVLRGGFPKLVLLAEFTGETEEEALRRANEAYEDLKQFKLQMEIMQTSAQAEKFWKMRHDSFNIMRKHSGKNKTAPFTDDIIVDTKKLPEFLPKLEEIMEKYKIVYTIQGHIGDGNFHIFPLMDLHEERYRDMIVEIAEKVFALVFEFGGSMSAEHNDGIIRTPFLRQMYGDKIISLFEETKNIFDPQNIFNPGKKVHGHDLKWVENHIDKDY